MIQLRLLSGQQEGTDIFARKFPFSVGRSRTADLCLSDPGVWDKHCEIGLEGDHRFTLHASPSALINLNDQRVESSPLRNGDVMELGSVKIRFWLAPTRQRGLAFREGLTWLGLGLLLVAELLLIYQLTG